MTQNAEAPRNGGRVESTFQSRVAPPLSRNVSIGLRQLVNEFTEVAAPFRWSVSAD
jgi:hypothetical protein